MKPVSKFALATAAFTITGVALACTVLPMLPFSISVDLKDIAAAKQAGASSAEAPNKAFLKKLDETAERTFGADAWRNTSFVGNVMYKTKIMMMTGSSMITVSKPCGKSAEESGGTEDSFASTPPSGGGGGGGSTGGGGGIGGWFPGGGGCFGNCQPPPPGRVGPIENLPRS